MSAALDEWREASDGVFNEIERMLESSEGTVGPLIVTQQLNYAYAMLITAHFQRYCRELHAETAQVLVAHLLDPALGEVLEGLLAEICAWTGAIPPQSISGWISPGSV